MSRSCSASGQLLEQVGEALVVHRRGELAALGERQGAHDVGDLGRVHVAQPGGLGGASRWSSGTARHLVDVDEAVARLAAQHVAPGAGGPWRSPTP